MNRSCIPRLVLGQRHPDWMLLYEKAPEETLPWYIENLDPDFAAELSKESSPSAKTLLEVGAGLGGQAAKAAEMGFQVFATEVSPAAVSRGSEKYSTIRFLVDDIRQTKIVSKFDFIMDRGCFHVLDASEHTAYLKSIIRLLKPEGTFLLKVLNHETGASDFGPLRFSLPAIQEIFIKDFEIIKNRRTVFQGTTGSHLKAWFLVMRVTRSGRENQ